MNSPQTAKKIEGFIARKVKNAGAHGAVVGLSGGLDSALVATLCTRALGPDNVLALIMPSIHTKHTDVEDAKQLAGGLEISERIIPISSILESFEEHISNDEMALGNLMARIRMCMLYYHANHLNYLVIGTGNKSELSIGYFTKFGDGGCDILPIGDLYKTEVRKLAKYLEVPQRIINKEPSAGFWPGQTDEEELGMSYNRLDKILRGKLKDRRIEEMIKKSRHKRRTPEVCSL
jgi:NAD+ synthase